MVSLCCEKTTLDKPLITCYTTAYTSKTELKMNAKALYNEFLVYCGSSMEDMKFVQIEDFCQRQFPIVEEAILGGKGIHACDSRAHDLTCSFVELKVISLLHN